MKAEDIRMIAVIGAGDMGHGIAASCLLGGYHVVMQDIKEEFVERGAAGIKSSIDRFLAKGKLTPEEGDAALARLTKKVDLQEAVRDADFIIEAVPEKLELKQGVFAELDKFAPAHAILATNTSTMSITDIAAATKRPDRVIGYHFFNPAVLMKLVEVIRGDESSDESIETGRLVAQKIGKVPVIVKKDSPGFVYNRINGPTLLLLSKILEAGHPTPEEFDAAFKPIMPMAPFELLDYTGIDITVHALNYLAGRISEELKPSAALESYVKSGNLGKKTGRGFYDWSDGRPKIDLSKATADYDANHLIALQVNEATKLLDEGVVDDPAQIDLVMVHGSGTPLGPFTLAQGIGYPLLLSKLEEIHGRFPLDIFKATDLMKEGNIGV